MPSNDEEGKSLQDAPSDALNTTVEEPTVTVDSAKEAPSAAATRRESLTKPNDLPRESVAGTGAPRASNLRTSAARGSNVVSAGSRRSTAAAASRKSVAAANSVRKSLVGANAPRKSATMVEPEDQDEIAADTTRSAISKQLMHLLDEDTKEFTELDIKEILPSTPFSDTSFTKLRKFFNSVIQDLHSANKVGIPLDEILEEFYFLWEGIQKSHENLKDLLQKDVALTVEVADCMAKTRNLIRIAEDDVEITARLGTKLEVTWNLVDISEEEEKRNSSRVEELKTDIMILNRNIQAAANMEAQSELAELYKIRRKLQDERDVLHKEMGRMRTSLALLQERKTRLGEKKIEYQEAIKYADEEAAAQTEALAREVSRKDEIEKEMARLGEAIELKKQEVEDTLEASEAAKAKLVELENALLEHKVINEDCQRDAENAVSKLERLKHDFEIQVELVEKLTTKAFKKQSDLKEKEEEVAKIKAEGLQAIRQRNTNAKRCTVLQEELDKVEADREALKQKIIDLEIELENAQRKLEENRRRVEELDKERTVVNRNLTRAKALASEHENQLKVHLLASNSLEREVDSYKHEVEVQADTIHRLERDRDFYSLEATKLAHEFSSRLDEIKKMDTIVYAFRKKIGELEGTVKTKQQEYEQSLVEKRFFEKLLRDTRTAIFDSGREIRNKTFELNMAVYSYYDEQYKYAKQKAYLENLLREGVFFKKEADRIRKMAIDMQREVEALESERSLLGCGVAEAENELSKQRYYALQAASRQKNYNRRLLQRETELQDIWSKWRTLHSMVRIGAYHFRNLMAEIREKRQNIVNLRRLQHKFKGNVNHIVQLQQEISVLENCIAKETCMVNALEDELSRPINVHRWRALEAIDPDAYDTIKKINIVTKRLVDQNEAIRKQSIRIADKERIYVDLRHVLRRLPSLETPELRRYYEVLLRAKREQLKKIKLDLYALESQTNYFRNEVSKVNDRMKELKSMYFHKMKLKTDKTATNLSLPPLQRKASRRSELAGDTALTEFQEDAEDISSPELPKKRGKSQQHVIDLKESLGDMRSIHELYKRHTMEQDMIEKEIQKKKSAIEILANEKREEKRLSRISSLFN